MTKIVWAALLAGSLPAAAAPGASTDPMRQFLGQYQMCSTVCNEEATIKLHGDALEFWYSVARTKKLAFRLPLANLNKVTHRSDALETTVEESLLESERLTLRSDRVTPFHRVTERQSLILRARELRWERERRSYRRRFGMFGEWIELAQQKVMFARDLVKDSREFDQNVVEFSRYRKTPCGRHLEERP